MYIRYGSYTLEAIVSKVESSTHWFELKTISSPGAFSEKGVYGPRSLVVALKLLTHSGFACRGPARLVFFRSWRRMIIAQEEIPRMGLDCVGGVLVESGFWT